jgi:hypothetical protein
MHAIASGRLEGDEDFHSLKVFKALEGARMEVLASLESTYATFMPLALRNVSLAQALQGYDSLVEDLAKDMYLI